MTTQSVDTCTIELDERHYLWREHFIRGRSWKELEDEALRYKGEGKDIGRALEIIYAMMEQEDK